MLKKNQPTPLFRPSTMRTVFAAIQDGKNYRHEIVKTTKLKNGQVKSALGNLVFIGLVVRIQDHMGRSCYRLPSHGAGSTADCLKGIPWVFGVRFTDGDN